MLLKAGKEHLLQKAETPGLNRRESPIGIPGQQLSTGGSLCTS